MNSLTRRRMVGGMLATGLVGCTGKGSATPADSGTPIGSNTDTDSGSTPAADGFFQPGEWEPHAGCLIQFPPPDHYCFGGSTDCSLIERAWSEWAETAKAIAAFEPVVVYATPEELSQARALCGGSVTVVEALMDDGWSRDSGPVLVRNKQGVVRASCFEFNGWGGSYSYKKDAAIKWEMTTDLGIATYDHPMILEGGAVIVDGAGTLITTEQCLLHKTRNPDLSKAEQEQILKDYLGVHTVIWLEGGWTPDPITNGHIDGIVAFVHPGLVLLNSISQQEDPTNYAMLESARQRLEAAGIEVIRLPATSWTAFHINFYVANGAIIVPIEGRASVDNLPLGIIADAHPGYEIIGVEANALGESGGGIHCITQQVPEGIVWPF